MPTSKKYTLKVLLLLMPVLLSLVAFLSCSDEGTDKRLKKVELAMDSEPEKCLAELRELDTLTLKGDGNKALYALLLTRALDKNDLLEAEDTLIDEAVRYFEQTDDKHHRMMSYYYQGQVGFVGNDMAQAIVSTLQAHELARSENDPFWMGMSARALSFIYNANFSSSEELRYACEEMENFCKSGRQPYINYAILDLARAYDNNGMRDTAICMYACLVDSAVKYKDAYLYNNSKRNIAVSYLAMDEYDKALSVYDELAAENLLDVQDSAYMALLYVGLGELDKAQSFFDAISKNPKLEDGIRSKLYKGLKQYDMALALHERYDAVLDSIFESRTKQNLTGTIVEYFRMRGEANMKVLKATRIQRGLAVALLLLVTLTLGYVIIRSRKKYLKEISQKVSLAEQLMEENAKADGKIKMLLASQFSLLEDVYEHLAIKSGTPMSDKRIAAAVRNLIKKLDIDGATVRELEAEANRLHDNVCHDFRKDMPNLSETEYRLFLFFVLEFKCSIIAVIMGKDDVRSIYEYKRRLKNKIKNLSLEKQERYLRMM